jgi:hypothetical protein
VWRTDKASEVIAEAEKLGLRLEFDSGLAVAVKQKTTGDLAEDKQGAIIEELVKYLPEVRHLAKLRAISVRAKEFLGKQILVREVGVNDRGFTVAIVREGELKGVGNGDELTISLVREGRSLTLTSRAEDLLFVLNEEGAAGASSPGNEEQAPRKGLLERFRR